MRTGAPLPYPGPMILSRIPGRSARPVAPDSGRVHPVSPLGPAMVLAVGGVVLSAVQRMRRRTERRRALASRGAPAPATPALPTTPGSRA